MQILNFTEPLIKPALQDRSKCFTIRKAWDWEKVWDEKKQRMVSVGSNYKKFICITWRKQKECRHKVGTLEQIMWMQRGKTGECANCVFRDEKNRCIADAYARLNPEEYAIDLGDMSDCMNYDINQLFPHNQSPVFSKVFGVGKILEVQKIWMHYSGGLVIANEFKTDYINAERILREDGFKNIIEGEKFFVKNYPIITDHWMPFWRIGWKWRVEL